MMANPKHAKRDWREYQKTEDDPLRLLPQVEVEKGELIAPRRPMIARPLVTKKRTRATYLKRW